MKISLEMRKNKMRHYIFILMWFAGTLIPSAHLTADQSAVVLLYHRFGENAYPSTNVQLEQFESHIRLLKDGNYNFMSLQEAATRVKNRQDFPSRTVIITVDDAYKSVFTHGWPMLKAAGIPMTLFVSTDPVDEKHSNYMSWDDVRQLQADGVEIGHHTASHLHMVHAGIDIARTDVRRASKQFKQELGTVPRIFAYPYGEYNTEMKTMVEAEGFDAAFAQFSGPIAATEDTFALPRFPVNERYGDEGRFKLISQSMALPVSDVVPAVVMVAPDRNPPIFGFSVDPMVKGLSAIACYPSHLGKAADIVKPIANRVEVRFAKPFPKGRNRINCTMPAGGGRWYWYGRFFLVPGGKLD